MTPQDQAERDLIVADMADGVIFVLYFLDARTASGAPMRCQACGNRHVDGYRIWVQKPSIVVDDSDELHLWGHACWECMALIVGAGGNPVRMDRTQK